MTTFGANVLAVGFVGLCTALAIWWLYEMHR